MPDYFVVDINGKTLGRLVLDNDEIPKMMVEGIAFKLGCAYNETTKKFLYFTLNPKPKLKLHVHEILEGFDEFLRPGKTFVFKCNDEIVAQKFFDRYALFDDEPRTWVKEVSEEHMKTCNQ